MPTLYPRRRSSDTRDAILDPYRSESCGKILVLVQRLIEFQADDEKTLSHIPFLGDGDEDVGWCDELLEVFEEGIHGTKVGCGEYINDFILYHVIKNAQEKLRPANLSKYYNE